MMDQLTIGPKLRGILAGILKTDAERLEAGSNFFELGGYSLLALAAVKEINECFGIALPLTTIFEVATLADLETRISLESASRRDDGAPDASGLELEEGVI